MSCEKRGWLLGVDSTKQYGELVEEARPEVARWENGRRTLVARGGVGGGGWRIPGVFRFRSRFLRGFHPATEGFRRVTIAFCDPTTPFHLQAASFHLQAASRRFQAASFHLQAASCRFQAASFRFQAASFHLQAASCRFQAVSFHLQAASCRFQAVSCRFKARRRRFSLTRESDVTLAGILSGSWGGAGARLGEALR